MINMSNSPGYLRGNVTRDLEEKTVGANNALMVKFGVASDKSWKEGDEWKSETSFYDVVAWRKCAENCLRIFKKGDPVLLMGNWKQQRWTNDDGDNRSRVEFEATSAGPDVMGIESIVRRERGQGGGNKSNSAPAPSDPYDLDEEPF
jgi:single-strand DNA-binding protein